MINSMTAFARQQTQTPSGLLVWELKTVNHRYLEMNTRLPDSYRDLETPVRDLVKVYVSRGKIECSLRLQSVAAQTPHLNLNQTLLTELSLAIDEVRQKISVSDTVSALAVLQWPGVVQETECDTDDLKQSILALLENTLKELVATRAREGASIAVFMQQCLTEMSAQVAIAQTRVPVVLEEQRQKIYARIAELKLDVDHQRIEQELVLLSHRLDIAEELQRLKTHIDEVSDILKKGGMVGRRLDFLMQELNREANTLGSKSADRLTTRVSVELKVLIEQMREQVQNIE